MDGFVSPLRPASCEDRSSNRPNLFPEIVGCSASLLTLFEQIAIVASTHASVLIEGETGTGKELVARAIHASGPRSTQPFVKVNCAAIPAGLLESELFGHERGAFTGALNRKTGRVELADQGTLFLDEVGDLPLELQPKLLRLLQEHEFDRLGSTQTTHVNLRLLAATNRDLTKLVSEKQFRSDLYYRLRVFPIHIPPLRNRREDIPLLVHSFADKFAGRMHKEVTYISREAMDAMTQYSWPGNVRELENFIERCVILSADESLNVPVTELTSNQHQPCTLNGHLEQLEKDHIMCALREANGVVSGPKGAAAKLGMKRTTLASRMYRLGILPRHSS